MSYYEIAKVIQGHNNLELYQIKKHTQKPITCPLSPKISKNHKSNPLYINSSLFSAYEL